jgi:alpha-galactosidase
MHLPTMMSIARQAALSVAIAASVALCGSGRVSIAQVDRCAVAECPRINGPAIYGARPNHPFLYRIPSTGTRPMTFSAVGLPAELTLDSRTGVITGNPKIATGYMVQVRVANSAGSVTRKLQIIIGDKIALTPPMGWSSWNFLQTDASDKDIRAEADALIGSGLADHGYSYINIDDGWEEQPVGPRHTSVASRNPDGTIRPNSRFPNMKALTTYTHAKGLKAGIYSTPSPLTCGRFEGSYGHEEQDADQFARWGFDLLKYDLCSYPLKNHSVEELRKPFAKMGQILSTEDRDILFSLSEGGQGDVWKWGCEVGAQMWRTGGDLAWGPKGVYSSWDNIVSTIQEGSLARSGGPSGWNDPDYLLVGRMAYIPYNQEPPFVKIDRILPPPLTPDEQFTQMSFWSLMAAPLMIGGDLTTLDQFSLSLLSNDEVIAIDQDPLGRPARQVTQSGKLSVWVKDLDDGSKAVGIFNMGEREEMSTAQWNDMDLTGEQIVRDLWKRQDLGNFDKSFSILVPPHGVRLFRIFQDEAIH